MSRRTRLAGVDVEPDTEGRAYDDRTADVLAHTELLPDLSPPRLGGIRSPGRIAIADVLAPPVQSTCGLRHLTTKFNRRKRPVGCNNREQILPNRLAAPRSGGLLQCAGWPASTLQ